MADLAEPAHRHSWFNGKEKANIYCNVIHAMLNRIRIPKIKLPHWQMGQSQGFGS
jgi:hypothetical protein